MEKGARVWDGVRKELEGCFLLWVNLVESSFPHSRGPVNPHGEMKIAVTAPVGSNLDVFHVRMWKPTIGKRVHGTIPPSHIDAVIILCFFYPFLLRLIVEGLAVGKDSRQVPSFVRPDQRCRKHRVVRVH